MSISAQSGLDPSATLPDQTMEDESTTHASRRDRSIKLAVVTSFLSKGGTILLQFLAIPIAVRVMGREEFGVYSSVSLALSTVALLEIGIGPALAHGLSKANAADDKLGRRELSSTAFFMMVGLALLAGALLATVLSSLPLTTLFGDKFGGLDSAMRPALWLGLVLFLLLFVLNLTDRIREGLLEVAATNTWGAVGNVLAAAAVAIGVGVFKIKEVWFLVLAIHGAVVVAKLGNTIGLWTKYRDLIPSIRHVRRSVARHLFGDGLAFSTCCLLVGVVEYNVCGWMVGHELGPSMVALYGVFVSLTINQLGFVIMLSTPTWPAVAEAIARNDLPWARKAAKKLYLYGSVFALCSAAGLVLVGPWALELWLGESFSNISRGMLAAYGFYVIAHIWRHLNHALTIGVGKVTRLARVQLIETFILAIAAWAALRYGGVGPMLFAMGVTILAVTGWILPRLVRKELSQESAASGD
ncbi:lipopolysaccharide biosynthesis protein [Haloferula sp.]|uniref:lipopolysaccharide biosynthesis protein n=1 Tax=Haloferula sp. TaxID=2497595 RepID=UPI00329E458E